MTALPPLLAVADRRDPRVTWYRYVAHDQIVRFLAAGWRWDADLGGVHGAHASLFVWTGDGDPPPREELHAPLTPLGDVVNRVAEDLRGKWGAP